MSSSFEDTTRRPKIIQPNQNQLLESAQAVCGQCQQRFVDDAKKEFLRFRPGSGNKRHRIDSEPQDVDSDRKAEDSRGPELPAGFAPPVREEQAAAARAENRHDHLQYEP